MAQHTLDLGQLDLVSTTSSLRLRLASSAQVASDADIGDLQSLVEGGEHGIWTTLAAEFHVGIELLNMPERISAGRPGLCEKLAQALFEAPLWQQLQLQPSATETTLQASDSIASLRTYVSHAAHGIDGLTRKMHKIARDVPHHDVEPPPGIGRAELRAVRLQMTFSDTSTFKRRKLPATSHDELQVWDTKDDVVSLTSKDIASSFSPNLLNMAKFRRTWTTPERAMSSAHGERLESMVTSKPSDGHLLETGPSRLMHSLKRCSSTSDIDAGSNIHDGSDAEDLFLSGLHYAILTPSSRCSLKTIAVAGSESFKQLAHIWPAIFSAGSMEIMSSRAVFLPTISHALTAICGAQARSATLRSKFAELDRRHVTERSREIRTTTLQNMLSCRLWKSMQHGLFQTSRLDALMRVEIVPGTAKLPAGSIEPAECVEDHVAEGRTHDEHLSRLENNGLSTDFSAAGSYPEDIRDGHAVDTSHGPKARDSRILDAEDDLSPVCGSVDSLCLEDSECLPVPSDERRATVSSAWADLELDGEDLMII